MKTEGQESTLNDFTGFTADTLDFFGENSQGTDVETENLRLIKLNTFTY